MSESKNTAGGKQAGLATSVIRVRHRENATWQGDIFWAEENRSEEFRSMLEMIHLIDSALDEAPAKKKERE